ncbi:MAG TPA: FtsX-like permease family protein, partial [Puia sp.]|nr:FtsX-like permease family protein [Puia sp.]
FASGLYPAFFLSRFSTISALKGQAGSRFSGILFRKTLVTFQFVIAITLIAGSLVIYHQLQYVLNKDLGFNKEQVLTLHIQNRDLRTKIPAIKEKLLQNPLIESVSAASNPIGNNNIGSNGYFFEQDGKISTASTMVQNFMADADYLNTMQIKLVSGRNFSDAFASDRLNAMMVNETLVRQLGWKEPIGKKVQYFSGPDGERSEALIVGVVKDFNIYSLQHKIEPLLLRMPPVDNEKDNLYIRIGKKNNSAAIKFIETTFQQFDRSGPFEYHFLDQNFANQYAAEEKQQHILFVFTTLAILIACLGLFGLVSFTAEQRTKEIGVRKVLGASVRDIITLLSKDLMKLVLVAACIAFPLAWLAMNKWLEDFAYRVNISWWIFAGAGLTAMIIALITVGFRAIKAAMANPVQSLRSE